MTQPDSNPDAVIEARELLAKATQGPWRAVALLTDGENHHVLAGKFSDQHIKATSDDHNGLVAFADLPANTELIARAPELLRTLADEVEFWRGKLQGVSELDDIRHCDKCDLCEVKP